MWRSGPNWSGFGWCILTCADEVISGVPVSSRPRVCLAAARSHRNTAVRYRLRVLDLENPYVGLPRSDHQTIDFYNVSRLLIDSDYSIHARFPSPSNLSSNHIWICPEAFGSTCCNDNCNRRLQCHHQRKQLVVNRSGCALYNLTVRSCQPSRCCRALRSVASTRRLFLF